MMMALYKCFYVLTYSLAFEFVLVNVISFCMDRDEMNRVVHSDDAFAQVAYLNICKMHLEDKAITQQVCSHLSLIVLKLVV